MSLSEPSKLFAFLNSLGVNPKKSLSQNFLIDGNIMRKIIDSAEVKEGDCVLEIGPGPGVLTEAFIARKAKVIAVEKDNLFAKHLLRLDPSQNYLKVYNEDILQFPLESALTQVLKLEQKAKVISNLPYQLTSPILGMLLPRYDLIHSVTVMVQKEFADRMIAKPNSTDSSSLSIFVQFYSSAKKLFSVSPKCFYPVPKVTSAIVQCHLKKPPSDIEPAKFFNIVKTAFNQKRKMLTTSLKALFPDTDLSIALNKTTIHSKARPENLSLDDWLSLYRVLII